jgi:hypothetical protein
MSHQSATSAEDHVCQQHRESRQYGFLSCWDSLYGRLAATGFEAELELLEQDAEGDPIDDEGLDLSTGAILMA